MKGKTERQRIIKKLLADNRIASQEELAAKLGDEGIEVAQATLSRDIKELKVTKLHDGEGYYYSIGRPEISRRPAPGGDSLYATIESLGFSGNIAIIKTRPGHASLVSTVIDSEEVKESAGTVAGDDTIILVIKEGSSREDLVKSIGKIFRNIGKKIVD
ncbi:MAG: hypothetical protein IK076_04350 [Bacteroidales bacterium]|nr:hypothetical protein [Bacteroidales bacterium]